MRGVTHHFQKNKVKNIVVFLVEIDVLLDVVVLRMVLIHLQVLHD